MRRSVVLPQPLGPSTRRTLPVPDVERHAIDRGDVAEALDGPHDANAVRILHVPGGILGERRGSNGNGAAVL